ncbi:MAG: DNA polymerase Y family protein [Sphingobium sp.]
MRDRRYLALFFPWLPTERLNLSGVRADGPHALVEKLRGAMRLVAVDKAAAALGLVPGLSMADARARWPNLALFDHDPHADGEWLDRLADGCGRYTPVVALDPPDGLILDIRGCAHLFGGEAGLLADMEDRLARMGMSVRLACANTPEGARALARHGSSPAPDEATAIRRLPVRALELEEEALTALRRAGLKTVGDVARRPLANIAARFGQAAVTAIRRITGDEDSTLVPRHVVPPPSVERRFAEPVARTETVLLILEELAHEAVARLEEAHEGGRRFDILLFRTDGLVRRLSVETGSPSRDVPALMRLVRERVETLADPLDPGFGFDLVRLIVPLTEKLGAAQLRLEGGAVAEAEVMALVERLSTRLGRGRIRRFAPRDTHIPEQAEFSLPALDAPPPLSWPIPAAEEPPLRPIHLFDPPQPIEVLGAEVPDGPPLRFRWRRVLHEVARFEGPERIAAQWWRQRPIACDMPRDDGGEGETRLRYRLGEDASRTRDYYRVEDRRGRRFWIFRHGFFEAEKPMPRWYLHGLFA